MADWLQEWKKDKEKRDASVNPKSKNFSFKEASQAKRIQYTNPYFSSTSQEKNTPSFQWEKDMLGPLRGYGRSYDDRFKNLTRRMGMDDNEAQEFRTFLDSREVPNRHYETDSKGNITDKRKTVYGKPGIQTVNERIDDILKDSKDPNSLNNKFNSFIDQAWKAQDELAKKKEKQTGVPVQKGNERDGVLGFLDRTVGRLSEKATRDLFGDGFADAQNENYRKLAEDTGNTQAQQQLNTVTRPANGALEKTADVLGTIAGEVAPYTVGYGAADKALKLLGPGEKASKLAMDLTRGAIAGAGASAVKQGIRSVASDEHLSPEERLGQVLKEAALSAGGDAALGLVGRGAQRVISKLKAGKTPKQVAQEEGIPEEQVAQVVNEQTVPKNEPQNIQPQAQPVIKSQEELDQLLKDIDTAKTQRKAYEDAHVEQALAPFKESQAQHAAAEQTWQTTVKQAKETSKRIKDYYGGVVPDGKSKDLINEIPPQFKAKGAGMKGNDIYKFAEEEGFSSPDEAVQFLKQLDADSKLKLKDLAPNDGMKIQEDQWKALEDAARKDFSGTKDGQAIDSLLNDLTGIHKQHLDSVEQFKAQQVDPVQEAKDSPFLMRLNSQKFNEHENTPLMQTDKPMESKTAIEAIKNPVQRTIAKFYEGYVNRTHSAKVAETHILNNEMKKAQAAGNHALVKEYKAKLKEVKKSGSQFEKAIQNESASGNMAKSFLERHLGRLEKTVGKKDIGNALEYQMAKNLQWYKDNVDAEYKLPKGWDWGRVNDIVNAAELGKNAGKYEQFTKQFKDLTQEWRDTMLEYNLINEEAHKALSKNPYYIPLARDISHKLDNIDRGLKGGSTSNKRSASAYFVREMGGGDVDSFFKNPLEAITENTFGLYKNALKADTEQQAYRLAQMDTDGLFAKNITKKQYEEGGGIAVPTPEGKKYIRLQDDLLKVIQENELPMDMNAIGKITQMYAGLKTRSLEYQVTGAPRDIAQAYLNSQISNPLRYAVELAKAVKNKNMSARDAGAYFEHAYRDHVGGLDPAKVTREYAKKYKNVKVFDPKSKESWKELTSVIGKALDMPFKPIKALGQLSDELPRDVEVRVTKKLFMKKHGSTIKALKDELKQANDRIALAEKATDDFDPALNGIEDVVARKKAIEQQLNQFNKDLKREQTYRGRDVMNFSRSGRSGLAKHIRQYVIFANTTTQSKDKIIRSFIERPTATIAKAGLLMAPLVAAQQVIHQNMSKSDKDVYNKLPDYMKQFNYIFVNNGNVYTLPKLQELALISDPIEAALLGDKGFKRSAKQLALKELTPYQLGNVSQGLVKNKDGSRTVLKNSTVPGTVFTPGIDMVANKKVGFNKKPISYGDAYQKKGKDPKAGKYTMDIFKKLGHNKPAADYAEYAVKQYGGDAGKYLAYLADLGLKPSDKKKIDAAIQNLNPLQDRIYTNPDKNKGTKWFKDPFQETKK